jgi:uncharacterized LabA/DUF88 family protein
MRGSIRRGSVFLLLPALRYFGTELAGLFFGVFVTDRMVVFIDYQNTYMGAREIFHGGSGASQGGQFSPLALGEYIRDFRNARVPTTLHEVRVYRGMPDGHRDPKGYGAATRQKSKWENDGVTAVTRPLSYPRNYPSEKPREKGVDVSLAIDYISLAIQDAYDVGVLVSCDTDLRPALEIARTFGRKVEVAAWRSEIKRSPRLHLPGADKVWCHWLDSGAYTQCCDTTHYGKP